MLGKYSQKNKNFILAEMYLRGLKECTQKRTNSPELGY